MFLMGPMEPLAPRTAYVPDVFYENRYGAHSIMSPPPPTMISMRQTLK